MAAEVLKTCRSEEIGPRSIELHFSPEDVDALEAPSKGLNGVDDLDKIHRAHVLNGVAKSIRERTMLRIHYSRLPAEAFALIYDGTRSAYDTSDHQLLAALIPDSSRLRNMIVRTAQTYGIVDIKPVLESPPTVI